MRVLQNKLAATQRGFTLIELVIVIVIIGILAAVAIPQFDSLTDDANDASGQATLGAAKSAYTAALAAANGGTVTAAAIIGRMDPACTGTGPYTCGSATITIANPNAVTGTADITCTSGCN